MKDYYKILGVDPEAEPEVISYAYKALTKKYHPDSCRDLHTKKQMEERMKEINEAYEILSNPATRDSHDKTRREKASSEKRSNSHSNDTSQTKTGQSQDSSSSQGKGSSSTTSPYKDIFEAVEKGDMAAVESFIAGGISVNGRNAFGMTPLHMAIVKRHWNIATLLVNKGADVHARSQTGETPLHFAASHGAMNAVELLLNRGADLSITDNSMKTPLDVAEENGHREIVSLLVSRGSKRKNAKPVTQKKTYSLFDDVGCLLPITAFLMFLGTIAIIGYISDLTKNVEFGCGCGIISLILMLVIFQLIQRKPIVHKRSFNMNMVVGIILFICVLLSIIYVFSNRHHETSIPVSKPEGSPAESSPTPQFGEVSFSNTIEGATIKIYDNNGILYGSWDGNSLKQNPKLTLTPGWYIINISKPYYYDIKLGSRSRAICIESGKTLVVEDKWVSKPSILVKINKDAKILLNGREVGTTQNKQLNLKGLDEGTYKITAKRSDCFTEQKDIQLKKDQEIKISFDLMEVPQIPVHSGGSRTGSYSGGGSNWSNHGGYSSGSGGSATGGSSSGSRPSKRDAWGGAEEY